MKKLLVLLFFIVSMAGKADTLDNWQVYLNDSLIGSFHEGQKISTITLYRMPVDGDSMRVRYVTDAPCGNCKAVVVVRDEKERKLRFTESEEVRPNLSLDLKDLISFGAVNGSREYHFMYYERLPDGKQIRWKELFVLKLPPE